MLPGVRVIDHHGRVTRSDDTLDEVPPPSLTPARAPATGGGLTPWRAVTAFGVVSLAADMVYEGARSVTGPLLGGLGASALVVPTPWAPTSTGPGP